MARQRSTSGRQVGGSGGSGAAGVTSWGGPGARAEGGREAEAEGEAGGVPLTACDRTWV